MARSCGIRIGPRRFELIVLDGSAKKHRIAAFKTGEFPRGGEDPLHDAVALLREVVKTHNIPHDNVNLVIDTGLAAFRTIRLPFDDRAKIDQVLKFEVESQLPQWSIDDVVVDFIVMESGEGESNLLTVSVPKREVQSVLDLCQSAAIEPHEVELEATAMVDAALSADICHEDDAQVLLHIGDQSTAVVVMDGAQVNSVRAIHLGAFSYLRDSDSAEDEEGEPELDPEELTERIDQLVSRLRRELVRTVSGAFTRNPIEAIYLCGTELPGLVGEKVGEVPVYVLDVFEEDSGQPAEGTAPLVVSYGAALRGIGGGFLSPSLRREELVFTGKFERVELPLAMGAVLLMTLLAVFNIFEYKRGVLRDRDVLAWLASSTNFMLGEPEKGKPGNLELPPPAIQKYALDAEKNLDGQRTRVEQLEHVDWLLSQEIRKIQRELGQGGEVEDPQSALEGLALTLGVMSDLGDDLGRVSLHKVDSVYQFGRSGKQDTVRVQFDVTFLAPSTSAATQNYERFKRAIGLEPWCENVVDSGTKTLDDVEGIHVSGMTFTLNLSKLEDVES